MGCRGIIFFYLIVSDSFSFKFLGKLSNREDRVGEKEESRVDWRRVEMEKSGEERKRQRVQGQDRAREEEK